MDRFRPRVHELVEIARSATQASTSQLARPTAKALAAAAGVAVGLVMAFWLVTRLLEPAPGRFDFEEGTAGWSEQNAPGTRGCNEVDWSGAQRRSGHHALALEMRLDGSQPELRGGEAFVDLDKHPPSHTMAPVDLAHKRLTAWVWVPPEAVGDRNKPNGIRVFAKDQRWRSHYGRWNNVQPNRWTQLVLRVGAQAEGSAPDAGFDPSAVMAIGVRMDIAGESTATFSGAIYVDSVDW